MSGHLTLVAGVAGGGVVRLAVLNTQGQMHVAMYAGFSMLSWWSHRILLLFCTVGLDMAIICDLSCSRGLLLALG